MALREEIPALLSWVRENDGRLKHSHDLLCMYENDLLRFIEDMFKAEMGPQTYEAIRPRIPPINVLRKIIEKLAMIYAETPDRRVVDGSDQDQELLQFYVDLMDPDGNFNQSNEFLNLDRYNCIQPFFDETVSKPAMRAIPNDRWLPYSTDKMNPTRWTHLILHMGQNMKHCSVNGKSEDKPVQIYWAYTKDEFIIFDSDEDPRFDLMAEAGNPDGINPLEEIPAVMTNSSRSFLVPPMDSDTKRMTILIPALLSDLNYSAKYQSFSAIFAFNMQKEDWTFAPNAIHFADDKPGGEGAARVEVVKPQVDFTEIVQLIVTELSMWLNSRGIKPGSMGDLNQNNLASGISKIIDEMDTSEIRQKQAKIYSQAEEKFWELVLKKYHPIWVSEGRVENRHTFTPTAFVEVGFPPQKPIISRGELVDTAKKEVEAGFLARRTAMEMLNPDWSDERIEEEIEDMDRGSFVDIGSPEQIEPIDADPIEGVPEMVAQTRQDAPVADVAPDEVLNGAQVTALLAVTAEVSIGRLPKDSAKSVIEAVFGLSPERAGQIIDPIEVVGLPPEV